MATAAPEIPVLARDQAFESLYRRYVKDVYHYALALLRNPADAEDVTQTTFLNAYRAYQRGIEIEKPQNWLIKIAHNVARTRYARASRRVKEVPLDDHVDALAVAESDLPDLHEVMKALGRLPFNQRAALVMRELEGRSYAEISDTIGVSVSAVETLIFRARKSLRLKASAIRSLAVVPLPSSLFQFFEGGGLATGGGGALAGGFLIKAAVALVAGAVATGDRRRPHRPGRGGRRSDAVDRSCTIRRHRDAEAGLAAEGRGCRRAGRGQGPRSPARSRHCRCRHEAGSRPRSGSGDGGSAPVGNHRRRSAPAEHPLDPRLPGRHPGCGRGRDDGPSRRAPGCHLAGPASACPCNPG